MEAAVHSNVRLNTALQGVDVFVEIDGRQVKAVIPREVFERRLKSEPGPDAWLIAYEENAALLDEMIRKRFAAREQDFVVLRSSDFGATGSNAEKLR